MEEVREKQKYWTDNPLNNWSASVYHLDTACSRGSSLRFDSALYARVSIDASWVKRVTASDGTTTTDTVISDDGSGSLGIDTAGTSIIADNTGTDGFYYIKDILQKILKSQIMWRSATAAGFIRIDIFLMSAAPAGLKSSLQRLPPTICDKIELAI